MNSDKIEAGVKLLLEGLGCDLKDHNYEETPQRVSKLMRQMFLPPEKGWATFDEQSTDFICMRGHRLYTLCPHHLLLARFDVTLAYLPNGRVLGLSKLARVCHEVNRGPILQETFTRKVLDLLLGLTGSHDGACFVRGNHGCMQARGVKTPGDVATAAYVGRFEKDHLLQARFDRLALSGGGNGAG